MNAPTRRLSVTGLGYVGCPVAVAFGRAGFSVVAYDIDPARIDSLKKGVDRTGELSKQDLAASNVDFTADPARLSEADFHIVTVPTPVGAGNAPDLGPLLSAARTVGAQLRPGAIVVFESTVYPGATEEECVPAMERASGLKHGKDFFVGYSPERINPGDATHRFEKIVKVVAGDTPETTATIADVYGSVVKAGIHRAPDIRTAEMAKVIENTQRDLNIALMNELSLICQRLGLDTGDVLAAAATKWNFLGFSPGLVGGHCIGVDPYYLTFKAEQVGHHPLVILAGRQVNDGMGVHVARETVRRVLKAGPRTEAIRVVVLGFTFKEDVPDFRNTRVMDIVAELKGHGAQVQVHDPLADPKAVAAAHGFDLVGVDDLAPADAVVLAVPHTFYRQAGWPLVRRLLAGGKGLVADVRHCLDRVQKPEGIDLWRL